MATKKKVAKPVAKATPKKNVVKAAKSAPVKGKPVAKAAPKKSAAKPVSKPAVKAVAKKVSPVKPVKKPVPVKSKPAVAKSKKPIPVKEKKKISPVKGASKIQQKGNKEIKNSMTKKPEAKKAVIIKKATVQKEPIKKIPEIKKASASKAEPVKKEVIKVVAVKPTVPVKAKDIKVPAPKPVVIPKINTKTVRTYQPDFTKSVLDKAPRDMGAPTQRYSDADLAEFRELIQRKLETAKKELTYLHGLITRKDEMGGDDTDNRYMTMEDGSLSMEREQLGQMASRQITFIDHLEKAMMRIENKTYGICRVTGKLIDKARLRAVPHATLSIEAKMSSVK
jgi:hypothetical protein